MTEKNNLETILEDIRQKARGGWAGKHGDDRAHAVEMLILARLPEYAAFFEKTDVEVLAMWEKQRNVDPANFYQDSKFPPLADVRTFPTLTSFFTNVGAKQYRCPACEQVTADPYVCDSKFVRDGAECNWKAYGFFGTLGKGASVLVADKFDIQALPARIFMPIAWEATDGEAS